MCVCVRVCVCVCARAHACVCVLPRPRLPLLLFCIPRVFTLPELHAATDGFNFATLLAGGASVGPMGAPGAHPCGPGPEEELAAAIAAAEESSTWAVIGTLAGAALAPAPAAGLYDGVLADGTAVMVSVPTHAPVVRAAVARQAGRSAGA